ncbi:MAG: DUF308 domain-containing protein [Candidatus Dormibacteraeota bacterium]|nr:DUF308 domain-containing protein [Candidatus Dormibacteraeota bacterium]
MLGPSESTAATVPPPWWLLLLEGIAGVVIGFLLLTQTHATLFTLIVFVGAYWFATGIIDLVMVFVDSRLRAWRALSGVVGILAGLVLTRHPLWAAILVPATLVWVLGFMGIVIGVANLLRAFTGEGWPAAILGVISILLGGVLLFNTILATLVLVYVVAIWALIAGMFAIVAAFWLRSHPGGVRSGGPRAPAAQL